MASTVTGTKTIRMRNEVLEWVGDSGRAILESVHAFVETGALKFEDGVLKIPEKQKGSVCTPSKKDDSAGLRIAELEREIAEKDRLIAELEKRPQEEGRRWEVSDATLRDIEQMANLTGGTLSGLMDDLRIRMNSGEVGVVGGRVSVGTVDECPFDWRGVVEKCDDAGVDYDTAVKKFEQMMLRGMI